MSQLKKGLSVYLPDTRGVEISRYGMGNLKIGMGVFTYSRLAGNPAGRPSGIGLDTPTSRFGGTCPGSSQECEEICYAKRIGGPVRDIYAINSEVDDVPPIPEECQVLRLHISGDFDTTAYIDNWINRLTERPDVMCWAYTKSWRVPALLPALERLRALPNVQLFASMDRTMPDVPPSGWRRAWIDGDERAGDVQGVVAHADIPVGRNQRAFDGVLSLVCPEETKHKANCVDCGYCFKGKKNDVTFLRH